MDADAMAKQFCASRIGFGAGLILAPGAVRALLGARELRSARAAANAAIAAAYVAQRRG